MATKQEVKQIVEEALKKQEESLMKLINGKMEEIIKNVDVLKNEHNCLKKKMSEFETSLEFTQNLIEDKIIDLNNEVEKKRNIQEENIENNNKKTDTQHKELLEKLRTLEDRNRRNNLRIDGITENENETWDETEKKVKDLLQDTLKIQNYVNIERAHRMGKPRERNTENYRPRTIISKLLNFKDKQIILQNAKKLKHTGIYINEDFSDATNEIRKGLREEMKTQRENGKYSTIVYDKLVTRAFR